MSRPLRVGDRVAATGTVIITGDPYEAPTVKWDAHGDWTAEWQHDAEALTLIAPAEPPVGSVVVYDGQAWVRQIGGWYQCDGDDALWPDLSDGDVIFTPGGDA